MKQFTAALPKFASAVAILCAMSGGNAFAAGPANLGKGNQNTTNVPFIASFSISELVSASGITGCPLAGMISGIGDTNLFGKAILAATDCVTMPTPEVPFFTFNDGKFVLTAGSGETLFATYSGKFAPSATPGVWTLYDGQFSITGGTGRYTRATGSGTLTGNETLSADPFTIPAKGNFIANGLITY
jgi:hypothetical protein